MTTIRLQENDHDGLAVDYESWRKRRNAGEHEVIITIEIDGWKQSIHQYCVKNPNQLLGATFNPQHYLSEVVKDWSLSPDETAKEFNEAIYLAIDTIISNGNIYWTGEDIRKWLASEGFHIVKAPKAE